MCIFHTSCIIDQVMIILDHCVFFLSAFLPYSLFWFFSLAQLCTLHTWRPTEDFWCTCSQLKIQPYTQLVFPINQPGENSALSCWSFLCKAHVSLQGLSGYWFCHFASITIQNQRPCAHNIDSRNRRDISLFWFRLVKKDDWKSSTKMQFLKVKRSLTVPVGKRKYDSRKIMTFCNVPLLIYMKVLVLIKRGNLLYIWIFFLTWVISSAE